LCEVEFKSDKLITLAVTLRLAGIWALALLLLAAFSQVFSENLGGKK
jgi:hypothetical protein